MPRTRLLRLSIALALCFTAMVAAASTVSPPPDDLAALRREYRRVGGIPFPDDNPFSEAKLQLGQRLFFDTALSRSRTVSCGSCHLQSRGWSDGRALAVGDSGRPLPLHAPTLLDVAWLSRLGWDGKFASIESVAAAAITGPANMNLSVDDLMARLSADPSYPDAFARAFGPDAVTFQSVELALATFERTIVATDTAFDRWVEGDDSALTDQAVQGFRLFNGKAGCSSCHSGPSLTDGSFHDIGSASGSDIGRGLQFPSSQKLRYAFKTPGLRDIANRAPYMHNGSVPTLPAVIAFYEAGGIDRPSRSTLIRPLSLTQAEKADLLSFLQALSLPAPPR